MSTDIHGAHSSAYGFTAWIMHLYEAYRQVPDAHWMQLCGRIGNGPPRAIDLPNFQAWASGELTLFANDLLGSYFNNFGAATLVISTIHIKAD